MGKVITLPFLDKKQITPGEFVPVGGLDNFKNEILIAIKQLLKEHRSVEIIAVKLVRKKQRKSKR